MLLIVFVAECIAIQMYSTEGGEGWSLELFFIFTLAVGNEKKQLCYEVRRSSLLLHSRGTFLHLVVCFRPWRAHLNLALLSPAAPLRSTEVVLVAMEDT